MSEGAKTSANGGGFRFKVRGPRDFYGGLALIGLAIIAIWASGDLPGMHGFAFGPGTAPRLFASLLAIVGALVALSGLLFDGPPLEHYAIRGPLWVVLDPWLQPRLHQGSAAWLDPVHLCRLHDLHLWDYRDALGGKSDRGGGDDGILRCAVRLFAGAAVPALALVLSGNRHE
jgi:hypothetical protein